MKLEDQFAFLKELDIVTVTEADQARQATKMILKLAKKQDSRIAIDEEAATIDGTYQTLCVGFCPVPGRVWVFILDHPENTASKDSRLIVRKAVKYLLESDTGKTMHHGAYDYKRFKEVFDSDTNRFDYDTQFGAYLADPTQKSYGLLAIADRQYPKFQGYKEITWPESVPQGMTVEEGRRVGEFHLEKVPLDKLVAYNACDCHVTKMIEDDTRPVVSEPLVRVYTEAAAVLDEMQSFGPLLDFDHTDLVEKLFPVRQALLTKKLQDMAGNPLLNPNSYPQMTDLLYNVWKLPKIQVGNSKRKAGDTRKDTLEILQQTNYHEGVAALQDYREAKNRAERVAAFRRSAEAHNGRVTTFWWLTGTRTGRLSSGGGSRGDKRSLGNLQNIPSDTWVKNMLVSSLEWRDFFKRANKKGVKSAMKKYPDIDLFLSRDYSQMEIRVLAQVAGEKAMIKLFNKGEDIHAALGALWSNWDFKTIQTDSKIRRVVKALHFGIIYGLSPRRLQMNLRAQGVDISEKKAKGYMDAYWRRFKAVNRYRELRHQEAVQRGSVTNMLGFRTPIDVNKSVGSFWKNQAVNAPIQGSAHQVLLCALALLWRYPERYQHVKPQMEIHDSLITISSLKDASKAVTETRNLLEVDVKEMVENEFGIKWKLPLVTDINIGFHFGGLVEHKGDLEDTLERAIKVTETNEKALKEQVRNLGT